MLNVYQTNWERDHDDDLVGNHEELRDIGKRMLNQCAELIQGCDTLQGPNTRSLEPASSSVVQVPKERKKLHDLGKTLAAAAEIYCNDAIRGLRRYSAAKLTNSGEVERLAEDLSQKATVVMDATSEPHQLVRR